jgi:hypothetical protein
MHYLMNILVILKVQLYFLLPTTWLYRMFKWANRHADSPTQSRLNNPLFLINYRAIFNHRNIIYFSGPLKSHHSDLPTSDTVNRRIGGPVKLVTDMILRDAIDDPDFIEHNFKRRKLDALGVGKILVYGYDKTNDPYLHSRLTSIGLYDTPTTYYDNSSQAFTETVLVPKFATNFKQEPDGQRTRDASGRWVITHYLPLPVIITNFRLTFCAYSHGGEFLHQVRNCLFAYLTRHFTNDEIQKIFTQVFVLSAASNNPILQDSPNFTILRLINYHDEVVIKKLDIKAYYPPRKIRRHGPMMVPITANESVIWVDTPYRFHNYTYHKTTRSLTTLTNYGYHLERAYYSPFYLPDSAHRALLHSVQAALL